MAVYTKLSRGEIEALLATVTAQRLISWRGISAGVENSTYFLCVGDPEPHSAPSELVLTIAEHHSRVGVEDVAGWQRQLALARLPVPEPLVDRHGSCVHEVQGKPALLVPRCAGTHPQRPSPNQCAAVGGALAAMHRVALESGVSFRSSRDLDWLAATAADVDSHLQAAGGDATRHLLRAERDWFHVNRARIAELPHGVMHGDLFRDNALFDDQRLTAVIDFFMAGTGPLLLDLAIVVNDWCVADGVPDTALTAALLAAYAAGRPPTPEERAWWPAALRLAAFRFWVSRLADQMHADQGKPRQGKDPQPMLALLRLRQAAPQTWPSC